MATVIKGGLRDCESAAFQLTELRTAGASRPAANSDAASMLAAAHADAERIRSQAELEGFEMGRAEARRRAESQEAAAVGALRPLVEQVATELAQLRHSWLAQWEQQAIHLATRIAERIVRRELNRQADFPMALVTEALQLVAGKPDVRVLLSPEDHRAHCEHVSRLAAELTSVAQVSVVADPSISRGGCRVETRHGAIDQTLEAQLERIERELNQSDL